MSDLAYAVSQLQKRLANMIKRGRIHSIDYKAVPPRVRVRYGPESVTGWLPYVSGRASGLSRTDFEPLAIDEQVLVLSESGDLQLGVVVASLHDNQNAPPANADHLHVTRYDDGTEVSYDRTAHKLTVSIGEDGTAEFNGKTLFINADIKHKGHQHSTGNITSDADIKDKTRTMAEDREIYNAHVHPHGDPETSPTKQQQ